MATMSAPPVVRRIPPLRWRSPPILWAPLALAAAIGWPTIIVGSNQTALRIALLTGTAVFAVTLLALGASWALGRPPRDRRSVVAIATWAGAAIYVMAPFFLTDLAAMAANGASETEKGANIIMSFWLVPLSVLLGLPATLVSSLFFAWAAFEPPRKGDAMSIAIQRGHVQPFE